MNLVEGPEDGRRGREGRRAEHGLVQLPPRAGRDLAKQLIDEGKLGKIFHYRAKFLQDWTIIRRLAARRERACGGSTWPRPAAASPATCSPTASTRPSGSTARSTSVCAMTETFVKERKHNLTGKVEKVGIDDACAFLCRFDNGSLGLFESTRYARGHKALYTFEINGEKASLKWDLHDLHRLEYFDHRDEAIVRGWRSIHVTDGDHPYMKQLVGARPADRLRAHLRAPGGRLPREPGQGPADSPHLPRRPGHAGRLRRRARLGRASASGKRSCRFREPMRAWLRESLCKREGER